MQRSARRGRRQPDSANARIPVRRATEKRRARVTAMTPVQRLGLDLLVRVDRDGGRPLRSTRQLAAELGISRGVAVEAYAQLVAEGFLIARAGAATRVASVARHEP